MRKFYQTVILTGVATVAIGGAAFAATPNMGKAYDAVVAANTSVQAKNAGEAVKSLKSAKLDLRADERANKNMADVVKDKSIAHQIDSVVGLLDGKDSEKFVKAGPELQKIQDDIQKEMPKS